MHRIFSGLGLVSLGLIALTFALGLWIPDRGSTGGAMVSAHLLCAFFTVVFVILQKCAVFWHFIGSGIEIKHLTARHELPPEPYRRSWTFKMRVLPLAMAAALSLMAAVILAGAFIGGVVEPAWHWRIGLLAAALNVVSVWREHVTLAANSRLIAHVNALLASPEYHEPRPQTGDWSEEGVVPARDADRPEAQRDVGRVLIMLGLLIWIPYLYFRFVVIDQYGRAHPWLLGLCLTVSVVVVGFQVALGREGRQQTPEFSGSSSESGASNATGKFSGDGPPS